MAWAYTYDTATPDGLDDPSEADDRMREIKLALQERLAVEHNFPLTGTEVSDADAGKHGDITTTHITNIGAMENAGAVANAGDQTIGGTLDVTGNTTLGGTLGVTGIAIVAKGSKLASTDAPTTDAMLANKKYVDDQIAAEAISPDPMTGDNDSIGTMTLPNGFILKWGKLNRTGTDTTLTFAAAFPTACFQVFACAGNTNATAGIFSTHTITKTNCVIRASSVSSILRWWAIGR